MLRDKDNNNRKALVEMRQKFFFNLATVLLLMVGMIPLAMCFGFAVADTAAYVHRLFVLGIFGLLGGLVSFVLACL